MNVSHVSTYENVSPISSQNTENFGYEAISLIISDILKVLDIYGPVIYCPFCVSSFANKKTIKNHLSSIHYAFLWELTNRSIKLDICPFCSAQLFGEHLVSKHSLICHGNVLVETFFKKSHGLVHCLFCQADINGKTMVCHLEEFHALQFNEWFKANFSIKSGGMIGLVIVPRTDVSQKPVDINELNLHLENLQVMSSAKAQKSILKPSSHEAQHTKPSVRRVLSFEDEGKENINNLKNPCQPKETRRRSSTISWTSSLRKSCFQCAKCSISFTNHSQLVCHVKKEHRKLSLQPFYKCSLCGVKFYKSVYLKKHSLSHSIVKIR